MEIKPLIKEDFVVVQKDETISSLIGKLKIAGQRNALVFDQKKFLGTVENKHFLKEKLNPAEAKLGCLVKPVPCLTENIDLLEAANLMFQSNLNFLPIIRDKEIVGILYGLDLASEASKLESVKSLKVEHVKFTKPLKLKADAFLSSAIDLMSEEKLEQIPFVNLQGKLEGVISFRDILKKYSPFPARKIHGAREVAIDSRAFSPERHKTALLPVSSFGTTTYLFTISPEEKLAKAIELMAKNNLVDLIVVKGDNYLGMLTLKNILGKLASFKEESQDFNLKFVGLEKTKLTPEQKENFKQIVSKEASKLQREVHNFFDLVIHIKEYDKGGKKQKYSINLKLEYPGQMLVADKGKIGDWDINAAIRKAFDNLNNCLKSRFRGDSSHRKNYE